MVGCYCLLSVGFKFYLIITKYFYCSTKSDSGAECLARRIVTTHHNNTKTVRLEGNHSHTPLSISDMKLSVNVEENIRNELKAGVPQTKCV